jgi:hypothetical protein
MQQRSVIGQGVNGLGVSGLRVVGAQKTLGGRCRIDLNVHGVLGLFYVSVAVQMSCLMFGPMGHRSGLKRGRQIGVSCCFSPDHLFVVETLYMGSGMITSH